MLLMDSITLFRSEDIPSGKPIVMIYFRTDCPYCQEETKNIINNITTFKNFQVYFLSGSSLKDIKDYAQSFHLNQYPNIIVGKDYAHSFTQVYKPNSVPYLAIYNSRKELLKIYDGNIPINVLIAAIQS
jgi:hypothetical protein